MSITVEQCIDKTPIVPFLKWAGGKRWITRRNLEIAPPKYETYIEPFLGSAAVFFHLQPEAGILADKNRQLIEVYKAIRSDWRAVERQLSTYVNLHSDDFYYEERSRKRKMPHTRAAQLIYLNRTCWNGLYRVNLNGKFNVPRGTKNEVVLPSDNFEKIAEILENVQLRTSDFVDTIRLARDGDFIFADPPYTVKHNMNGFVKYNENIFSWKDQIRLRDALKRAMARGVQFSMTNADHDSVKELYKDFPFMEEVPRNSVLAGKSEARTLTTELLVRSWK